MQKDWISTFKVKVMVHLIKKKFSPRSDEVLKLLQSNFVRLCHYEPEHYSKTLDFFFGMKVTIKIQIFKKGQM